MGAVNRKAGPAIGEPLGLVEGEKSFGALILPLQDEPSAAPARAHLNDDLFVILLDVKGLQMAAKSGDKHLHALAERLRPRGQFLGSHQALTPSVIASSST